MYCLLLHVLVAIMHWSKPINKTVLHLHSSTEELPALLVNSKSALELIQSCDVSLAHLSVKQTQAVML